jgi:ATP-dependent Lon protease
MIIYNDKFFLNYLIKYIILNQYVKPKINSNIENKIIYKNIMSEKHTNTIKKDNKNTNDVNILVDKKIELFKDIIQRTILHVQKNKTLDILGVSDISTCIDRLNEISKKITEITGEHTDSQISGLQFINNELSTLFKNYGTENLEDLLIVCFGNNHKITIDEEEQQKFDLLKKYFHPTSYKLVVKKDSEDKTKNLDCSDITTNYKQLHMKVYGMKLYINNVVLKKSLIIYGKVDDIIVDFLNNRYISTKHQNALSNLPDDDNFKSEAFKIFMSSLILKDYLIYDNHIDFYNKFAGIMTMNNAIHQKQISQVVKEFIIDDMYNKRNTIISLLIKSKNYENQYLAYLLYDLLSNDSNGNIDTQEQTMLFDSFPWPLKQCFKQAMKKTIQYTNELSNFDINKIPLEQQICLLKANDNVKEKAMMKLKEVKAKSEDSGSKARQYLDGLLKIPFSVYKREPILHIMNTIREQFKDLYKKYNIEKLFPEIPYKEKYTNIEIFKYIKTIQGGNNGTNNNSEKIGKIKSYLVSGDKKKIIANIKIIDIIKKKYNVPRFKYSHLTKDEMCVRIIDTITGFLDSSNPAIINEVIKEFDTLANMNQNLNSTEIKGDITKLVNNMKQITDYMGNVKNTLDKAVHGHDKAKKQIERIIGQWINGEQKGACFGFEGNPGIGKTTLAKGLAECLKDESGVSRPFALIALGGDSNASTLVGHSYTYVGSTWSQIIQILMDKKCMNPIIVFDEVDKISKTEHGKEITGILTHLLDPTQNDCFQDKYFSGIDIDLSKVLFILSYNDVESIDKVLLDRVHRVKFESLSIEDKVVICNNHLLPEIYKKVGLEDTIHFADETIKFIVEEYTLEPGVRKLKEKLFEIVGEINLNLLKELNTDIVLPIVISKDDITNKYFKDKPKTKIHKIHSENKVGLINALWANSYGSGGVLPLQASFIPSNKFLDLVLTGSMGDVMKESISVSLTNAWNLTSIERQKYLIEKYNDPKNNNMCGIHIHCPDISTKKDGPSATTAFTVLIYSLFNNIKIKNNFGITGETHFGYYLTEIGGLREKIIHSIKSGITEFIFPKENDKDFDKIMEKYKDNEIIKGIKFHSINHITEVFDLILEK